MFYVRTTVGGEATDKSGSLQGAGGIGGLLKKRNNAMSPTIHYSLYDVNGNITQKLDASGATVMAVEYDPYGNVISGSLVGDYGFSTKFRDAYTGYYNYGYRWYDPVTGRWPNRDPIQEQGGLNLYGFVGNDGVNGIDVLGRDKLIIKNEDEIWYVDEGFLGRDRDGEYCMHIGTLLKNSSNGQTFKTARFDGPGASDGWLDMPWELAESIADRWSVWHFDDFSDYINKEQESAHRVGGGYQDGSHPADYHWHSLHGREGIIPHIIDDGLGPITIRRIDLAFLNFNNKLSASRTYSYVVVGGGLAIIVGSLTAAETPQAKLAGTLVGAAISAYGLIDVMLAYSGGETMIEARDVAYELYQ